MDEVDDLLTVRKNSSQHPTSRACTEGSLQSPNHLPLWRTERPDNTKEKRHMKHRYWDSVALNHEIQCHEAENQLYAVVDWTAVHSTSAQITKPCRKINCCGQVSHLTSTQFSYIWLVEDKTIGRIHNDFLWRYLNKVFDYYIIYIYNISIYCYYYCHCYCNANLSDYNKQLRLCHYRLLFVPKST